MTSEKMVKVIGSVEWEGRLGKTWHLEACESEMIDMHMKQEGVDKHHD